MSVTKGNRVLYETRIYKCNNTTTACWGRCPRLERDTGRQPSGVPGPSMRMRGEKLPVGLTGQLMCLEGGSTEVENL